MRATILIVEDEPAIAANVEYALRTDGFEVVHVTLASQALEVLAHRHISAVVLDVGLPDESGFELCRRIRRRSNVPVLFVTARGDEVDRIVGLEIGADDYVVKPFSPRELVARVRTILRRARGGDGTQPLPQQHAHATVGQEGFSQHPLGAEPAGKVMAAGISPFVVDARRASIRLGSTDLDLTRHEFLLLACMLREPERVFSRDELLQDIGAATASLGRSIDTHVKSLRAKLRERAPGFDPIRTHRGVGYSIHPAGPARQGADGDDA